MHKRSHIDDFIYLKYPGKQTYENESRLWLYGTGNGNKDELYLGRRDITGVLENILKLYCVDDHTTW